MNKLHVIAFNRRDAVYACEMLEQQGLLNPDYRYLRDDEVVFVGTGDTEGHMLRGLSLSPDEVVLVDGWDAHQNGWEVARELTMILAGSHGTLAECARVSL